MTSPSTRGSTTVFLLDSSSTRGHTCGSSGNGENMATTQASHASTHLLNAVHINAEESSLSAADIAKTFALTAFLSIFLSIAISIQAIIEFKHPCSSGKRGHLARKQQLFTRFQFLGNTRRIHEAHTQLLVYSLVHPES